MQNSDLVYFLCFLDHGFALIFAFAWSLQISCSKFSS